MKKIALVCDWLTGMRGGEKCLHAMCEIIPHVDIFSLVYYPNNFNAEFVNHHTVTSFIQILPGNDKTFRRYLPLFPKAIESFDFSNYDLVLSFSHCVAKGVRVPNGIPHICYCHTPVRYAWDMRAQYLASLSSLKKGIAEWLLNRLQKWDVKSANRVGYFIANSHHVQQRIKRCYGRDSRVIYPPVDIDRFKVSFRNKGYYLVFSAFVPYKRIDLAVQTFNRNGQSLIVAGGGPEFHRLKAAAKSNIEFVLNPDDNTAVKLYRGCKALIFPGEEDFGIVPLEAQACGKPVIAFGRGGALETVVGLDQKGACQATGLFFSEQTLEAMQDGVERFEAHQNQFSPDICRRNAGKFNVDRYKKQMCGYIHSVTGVTIEKNVSKISP